jgi:hypothetical protein
MRDASGSRPDMRTFGTPRSPFTVFLLTVVLFRFTNTTNEQHFQDTCGKRLRSFARARVRLEPIA